MRLSFSKWLNKLRAFRLVRLMQQNTSSETVSAEKASANPSPVKIRKVLVTGAQGFIGRHLVNHLLAAGYEVTCGVRQTPKLPDPRCRYALMDFTQDLDPEVWRLRLQEIDAVINTVGILQEQGKQTFTALHEQGPQALFTACRLAKTKLVINISALGADGEACTRYHRSKKIADDYLLNLGIPAVVLQPSLVFGIDGESSRLFATVASLPLVALPRGGCQKIQPVHVDELCEVVLAHLSMPPASPLRIPVVGPAPISLAAYLTTLRLCMGLGNLRIFTLPHWLLQLAIKLGKFFPVPLMDHDTLAMLNRGNTADASSTARSLGRQPRSPGRFLSGPEAENMRQLALLGWLLPLLRISLAAVWIWTGICSLGLYPVDESLALLERVGIVGSPASVMLYGAGVLDIALGLATLFLPRRRLLWLFQLALIVFYTAIISWKLPEFWLHPYGPVLKNLPMLALIFALLKLEKR